MKTDKILLAGFAGTSLMTIFSYLISATKDSNFKEPEQLARLLENLPGIQKDAAVSAGWAGHYSVGTVLAFVQSFLFQKGGVKPDIKNGLVVGALSGISGIMIWKLAFKMHPHPPRINFWRFAGHLLTAHLIYTLPVVMMNRYCRR